MNILVVEDSPAMRQLLAITIRRRGAQVVEAGDGLQALQMLATQPFDLMFVDLNMPILDGMKLIARVRQDPALKATRICVVTTEAAQATQEQARNLGADYFLKKPIARRDVEQVLAEVFPAASG